MDYFLLAEVHFVVVDIIMLRAMVCYTPMSVEWFTQGSVSKIRA